MSSIRYFTLEEAQGRVAWLEDVFQAMAPLRERTDQLNDQIRVLLNRIGSNGGGDIEKQLGLSRRTLEETTTLIKEKVEAIQNQGIHVKNIEQGLVDFPSLRDEREVYLCWHVGEEKIRFWHEVEAGFAGRQAL